jgi:hypothetical protein
VVAAYGGILMNIMHKKSIDQSIRDTEEPGFQLRKALGALDITVLGIGVIDVVRCEGTEEATERT